MEAGEIQASDDTKSIRGHNGQGEVPSVQISQALWSRKRPWAYSVKRLLAGLSLLGKGLRKHTFA